MPSETEPPDQGELTLPGLVRRTAREAPKPQEKPPVAPAATDPVARVLVDVPLAHLDRPFDYLVPATMADDCVPGCRVKVRFAGQDTDGFVLERVAASEHTGRLAPLRRVVSAEPVLSPDVADLTAEIARRWAGTRSDVLRLAVPPRHATTEKKPPAPAPDVTAPDGPGPWSAYAGGAAWLDDPQDRVVWSVLPGDDGADLLARAALATAAAGRGALLCVPDHRDLDRLDAALTRLGGAGQHVVLTAEAGPAKRYAAFLAVSRGTARIVVGTRAAAFAPVRDLGLVAIWDDGDDLYAEPRAPYPHTREVLLLRSRQTGCAALLAAHARSVEAEYLLRTGWAREVVASRETVRQRVTVTVAGASEHALVRDPHARTSRFPQEAHRAVSAGLATGPVLVQTPRLGYATRLACESCRTPAACEVCHGPLRIPGRDRAPECAWCGTRADQWSCPVCGARGLRSPVLGDRRTAEELGRAFPGTAVRSSSGDRVQATVPGTPAIVVATPGAEPVAEAGYAAVVLLDGWLMLGRADLRAEEEALRRWANAAALVRPGGAVVVVGDPQAPPVQALVRWDPGGYAERLILERQSAHLPPASRMATLTAPPAVLEQVAGTLALPPAAEVLGPVAVEPSTRSPEPAAQGPEEQRLVLRVPRADGPALSAALLDLQRQRSARKLPHVRVEVDPQSLG